MVTKDFLKQVLSGQKKLLKMQDVRFVNPPSYDEIGVKALYSKVIQEDGMKDYFPSKYPKGLQCDKSYFYNIWNTLYQDQVAEVIKYANSQRFTVSNDDKVQNSICISAEWQKELDSMPFISKQKGRMSALLKTKSVIAI